MKIFNYKQIDVFLKFGARAIGAGVGDKGKTYVIFDEKDEIFQNLMKRWMAKEFM